MENENFEITSREEKALIAISKTLAKARDGMSMQEKKLCAIYLSKLEWKNIKNDREIWIDKREITDLLGSDVSSENRSTYLRRLSKSMVSHSDLKFNTEDGWRDTPLFTDRAYKRNKLMIRLNESVMELLEGLQGEYITLYLSDILNFESNENGRRAYTLYQYLRLHSDTRQTNHRIISTKEFKKMWDISEDAYMHMDNKRGKEIFDRANFEKRVINPVLEMLEKCEHVVLHNYGKDSKGKNILFRKVKKCGQVQGYELTYSINKLPHKIKRETIVDIQDKPEVLKVAQDIIEHKKKSGSSESAKNYNSYEQRKYTKEQLEELESKLLFAHNEEQVPGQISMKID